MKYAANLEAVRSAIRTAVMPTAAGKLDEPRGVQPVITISRQAGTNVANVVDRLVMLMNQRVPGESSWISYDKELATRVADDHHLSRDLVSRLDETDKSWFEHLTAGITGDATGTDVAMKTAETILGVARLGRSIIVGRGGQAILAGFMHVVHIRLFAPLPWRAERKTKTEGVTIKEAEAALREIDNSRTRYVKHHFNQDINDPALYDVWINMSRTSADRAAEIIAATVIDPEAV